MICELALMLLIILGTQSVCLVCVGAKLFSSVYSVSDYDIIYRSIHIYVRNLHTYSVKMTAWQ